MQYPSGHWCGHVFEFSVVDITTKSLLVVRRLSNEGDGGSFVEFDEFVSPVKLVPVKRNRDVYRFILVYGYGKLKSYFFFGFFLHEIL